MELGTTKQAKINNKLVIMDHEIKQGARLRQIPTQYLLNLVDFYFKKQQKFCSLPKRCKQIRRFEQRPFVVRLILDTVTNSSHNS